MKHKRLITVVLAVAIFTMSILSCYAAADERYFSKDVDKAWAYHRHLRDWDQDLIDDPPAPPDTWTSTYGDQQVQWGHEYQTKYFSDSYNMTSSYLWNMQGVVGTGNGGGMVAVALSQVGLNNSGQPYWGKWSSTWQNWCAYFVMWCALQNGFGDDIIPMQCNVGQMRRVFTERGQFYERAGYTPSPGDVIFYLWDKHKGTKLASHVGLVTKVEGGKVYVVEGNAGTTPPGYCVEKVRDLNWDEIVGYGHPPYPATTTTPTEGEPEVVGP